MKRGSIYLSLGLVVVLAIGGIVGLVFLLDHVPSFYRQASVAPGKKREEQSAAFWGKIADFGQNFVDAPGPEQWNVEFTEAQINSYFEESFLRDGDDSKDLERQGVTAPRVCIEKDRLRLGFHYKNAVLSTVISLDLRIWLVPNETNVIAIEILGRHAGGLPISVRAMQEDISNLARKYKMEATWYRHEGHPVALLRLRNAGQRPPSRLLRLDLAPGALTIGGVSLEMTPNAKAKQLPPQTQLAPMAQ